tara:strand:- start:147 stop:293 length:147 start_codon:yes stop_codon:yes gene_type:complete
MKKFGYVGWGQNSKAHSQWRFFLKPKGKSSSVNSNSLTIHFTENETSY